MKILSVGIVFLISSLIIGSSGLARDYYLAKNYREANMIFFDQVQEDPNNFSYNYNLASSFYRLDKLVEAKAYYLKALKIKPNDKDTKANLKLINQTFVDKEWMFKDHWPHILGISFPTINALSLFILALILISFYFLFSIKSFRKFRRHGVIILIIWGSFLVMSLLIQFNLNHYGILNAKKIEVYSGPSKTQTSLFYVHEGAEFKIMRSAEQWTKVQFSNGLKGWIEGIYIISI